MQKIEKLKQITMLRAVASDCRQVKQEYRHLKEYLESRGAADGDDGKDPEEVQSDLVKRVIAVLER